jgi:hypothetical protein
MKTITRPADITYSQQIHTFTDYVLSNVLLDNRFYQDLTHLLLANEIKVSVGYELSDIVVSDEAYSVLIQIIEKPQIQTQNGLVSGYAPAALNFVAFLLAIKNAI